MLQFFNVISSKRLLILGSVITRIAIFTTRFYDDKMDLHIFCPQTSLDLQSSDDMDLLELKYGLPCFAPTGLLVP